MSVREAAAGKVAGQSRQVIDERLHSAGRVAG